jgi:hypothetical protein
VTEASGGGPNRYGVRVEEGPSGWRALIVDPGGRTVSERACSDESEARLYASTVEQHVGWLSEEQFRRYYRLPEPEA